MGYKIINEWFSKDGRSHEITIYKYNYSFDLVMRYNYTEGDKYVTFTSQSFGSKVGMLEGKFEVKNLDFEDLAPAEFEIMGGN